MSKMKFRIEYVAKKARPAYLFARQLEPGDFEVTSTSRLGDTPLRPHLSQPRAHTPDGKPDLNVFAFFLVTADDLPKLKVGQVVELSDGVA
jgi:hypothetical protein